MNLKVLQSILNSLSEKRLVFYNEADFQHALAKEIREYYTKTHPLEEGYPIIRLEKSQIIKMNDEDKEINVDIEVGLDERTTYFLELKYCTDVIKIKRLKENFTILKNN